MHMWRMTWRDALAVLAGLAAPLALAALLVPFRGSFPNTDGPPATRWVRDSRPAQPQAMRMVTFSYYPI